MRLTHDTILAPDRTYPWFASWSGARPATADIVQGLRTLESLTGEPDRRLIVPVVTSAKDQTAAGVVWPFKPVPVAAVVYQLLRLGAVDAGVAEWPDDMGGAFARAYWDRYLKTGIEGGKALEVLGDATSAVLRTALLAGGLGLGVYLAITRR